MELLGLVAIIIYCGVSLVVGLRLLLLARRTRELPERLIGSAFVVGGAFGYPIVIASGLVRPVAPELARVLFHGGSLGLVAAAVCLLLFWQRVYHAEQRAAWCVVGVGALALVVALVGLWLTHEPGIPPASSPWFLPEIGAQGAAYAINAGASTRTWRRLRRRLALDLVEPAVVERVGLWSFSAWAVSIQYAYTLVRTAVTGEAMLRGVEAALVSSIGLVAAVSIGLAFFPLAFLRRSRVESEAGAQSLRA
jgi:hypothetical protein